MTIMGNLQEYAKPRETGARASSILYWVPRMGGGGATVKLAVRFWHLHDCAIATTAYSA